MTTDEAAAIRDAIADRIRACPPEAIARLVESDPAENILIQARVVLRAPDHTVVLVVQVSHEASAVASDGPAVPAEHYADVARKGGMVS